MIFTRCIGFIFILFWISNFLPFLYAAELSADESQKYLIRGVYYLINQNDLNSAESEFRQAIALDQHNWEAYYFLGSIYYERATTEFGIRNSEFGMIIPNSEAQSRQFIGKAKAFLLRAFGLRRRKTPSTPTYDKLHPDLLSRLKQEYPKVAPIYEEELFPKKAKIIIETEAPTFEIRASKISKQDATVNESITPSLLGTFLPGEEIQLEGDASYQLEFLPQKPKSIKLILLVGIGLTISWLIR